MCVCGHTNSNICMLRWISYTNEKWDCQRMRKGACGSLMIVFVVWLLWMSGVCRSENSKRKRNMQKKKKLCVFIPRIANRPILHDCVWWWGWCEIVGVGVAHQCNTALRGITATVAVYKMQNGNDRNVHGQILYYYMMENLIYIICIPSNLHPNFLSIKGL